MSGLMDTFTQIIFRTRADAVLCIVQADSSTTLVASGGTFTMAARRQYMPIEL